MERQFIQDSDFSKVPFLPGVYSWYYPLIIFENDTFDSFYSRISFFLDYSQFGQEDGFSIISSTSKWREWELTIKSKINPAKTLKNNWLEIKENQNLRNAIEKSSVMFQPLYVGCAKDLSKRIKDHIDGKTGFSDRFIVLCKEYKKKYPNQNYPFGAFELERLHLSFDVLQTKKEATLFEKFVQTITDPNLSKA
jgi:hypothetical protein